MQRKRIFTFTYKQKDWNDFAIVLHRNEVNSYVKIFSIVGLCFIVFLVTLALLDDLGLFIMFSFIIGIIMIPILILYLLRFKRRKRAYLENETPTIIVNEGGIVINSEIHYPFYYLGTSLQSVKIEKYESKECFCLTIFYPSHNLGGRTKTVYIPISGKEKRKQLVPGYLKKLEELIEKNKRNY